MKNKSKSRSVSQRKSDIEKSVDLFLRTDTPAMRQMKAKVLRPLQEIGQVGIVGGLVRDIIRYGVDKRPISDIDLVVEGSPSAVRALAQKLGANPNRFGGYNFIDDHCKVDFWALSTTWARINTDVEISKLSDLTNSTFFNWDAVIYSIQEKRVMFKDGYLDDIRNKTLEINLEQTPSPKGNLIRALRRLYGWQAIPGPRLKRHILGETGRYAWDEIIEQERLAFHTSYLERFSNYREYFEYLVKSVHRIRRNRQLSLFSIVETPIQEITKVSGWVAAERPNARKPQEDQQQLNMNI